MKQTALHGKHESAKVRMTDFQGWQIPLQFSDVQDEYHAVRYAAGLFDIGHLGRIEVSGPAAAALLQDAVSRNVEKVAEGASQYVLLCNDEGFLLDNAVLLHLPQERSSGPRYYLTTNACSTAGILDLLREQGGTNEDVRVIDRTAETAHLALQGPSAPRVLEALAGSHYKKLRRRAVRQMAFADATASVIRIGWTGEHGYEFILPADRAAAFWDAILAAGKEAGALPCGLAARDLLRLEMGYVQYGIDVDATRTPLEAGLAPFLDLSKEFTGRDALLAKKAAGTEQRLAGFLLLDKGVPKGGASVFSESREIGSVTSGGLSPALRAGIGLGYVISRYVQAGQEIEIEVRDREVASKIVDLPFYKKK